MKNEDLRKVKYQRDSNPEIDSENYEDLIQERNGWFHQWIKGENIALIENEDGKIEQVESDFLKFIED